MVKSLKLYKPTISLLQMEDCYFTRTSLQVFFIDFDGNFKITNNTMALHLLKQQNSLRLLLGTKISYFRRCGLMKNFMAKCYNFYGLFLTRTFKNNYDRYSVKNSNAKPLQIRKSCFTLVVHVGLLREKKLIKLNMRKTFYNKIFCPKEKKFIHHCLWFKLSVGVV